MLYCENANRQTSSASIQAATENLLLFQLKLGNARSRHEPRTAAFYDRVQQSLGALPGNGRDGSPAIPSAEWKRGRNSGHTSQPRI